MKKIFTLILVAAGTIGAASAQTGKHQNIAYHDNKKIEHYDAFGKAEGSFNKVSFKKEDKVPGFKHDKKIAFKKSSGHFGKKQKALKIKLLKDQQKKEFVKMKMQHARNNIHTHNR